jgi:signal transduction histidine kinase
MTTAKSSGSIPHRLLVIEDDEASRYALVRLLKREGFDVIEAATGLDGLARAATQPDLIILDIHLPDIDGVEVRRRIKADPAVAGIPLVHLTSTYKSSTQWAAALEEGVDAYLTHPVESIVLLATIRSQLRLRETEIAMQEALTRENAARRDAEESNRLKDQFLATLSHELRSPLHAIVGWAHLLRLGEHDPKVMERAIDAILRNCQLQTRLIEDILDVSRIVSSGLRLELEQVDINGIVAVVIESVAPAATAKRIEISLDLLPDKTLVADHRRLHQAIWNLVSNAVKFTPEGGKVKIKTAIKLPDNIVLSIEDTGIGVPKDFLPFVFDRFRQADASVTREHSGLGLGLAIVRHIAELHGGRVGATSEGPDRGSRFWIELPMRTTLPETGPPTLPVTTATLAARDPQPVSRETLRGRRILTVDDSPESLTMIGALLATAQATVVPASSAEEAIRLYEEHPADGLVSDIAMPRCDGIELLTKLREIALRRGLHLPAIALSALAGPADRHRALRSGFDAYVTKPVDPSHLIGTLSALFVSPARDHDEPTPR